MGFDFEVDNYAPVIVSLFFIGGCIWKVILRSPLSPKLSTLKVTRWYSWFDGMAALISLT